MAMPIFDLQPMSIGDILDRTIRLYRRGFLHNIAIVAIPYILLIPFTVLVGSSLHLTGNPRMLFRPGVLGLGVIVVLAFIWLSFMSMGALARSVSERYLGEEPTVGGSYAAVLRRTLSLIWAYILAGFVWVGLGILMVMSFAFVMLLGPIASAVAGVLVAILFVVGFIRLLLITQIIVIEDIRGVAALQRSWNLMRGNFWRTVLIFIFYVVVSIVLSVVLNLPGGVLAGLAGGSIGAIINQVFQWLSQILLTPVLAIAITLLYYDSRIRTEAFDLEVMAQNLGVPGGGGGSAPEPWEVEPSLDEEPLPPPAAPPRPAPVQHPPAPSVPPRPRPVPAAAPRRPAGAPAPRPSASPFKICPQCQTQVPAIKPNCPKCGARVPYRSAH
jgi:hypothetical protein